MRTTKSFGLEFAVSSVLALIILAISSSAESLKRATLGVNVANADQLTLQETTDLLAQIHSIGCHLVRIGLSGDKGLEVARRAKALGIRLVWNVGIHNFVKGAKYRAFDKSYPNLYAGYGLSQADPAGFGKSFARMLDQLDASGIELDGIEIGNEINTAAFNPDFSYPGRATVLSLKDLRSDVEGERLSLGLRKYAEVLREARRAMIASHLNSRTPLIAGGFLVFEQPDGPKLGNTSSDAINASTTIDYLDSLGTGKIIDAYSLHVYPSSEMLRSPAARTKSQLDLENYALSRCTTSGNVGKPCWITEWGFRNDTVACFDKDLSRSRLFRAFLQELQPFFRRRSLISAIYFAWNDGGPSSPDRSYSLVRCGAVLPSASTIFRGPY